MFRSNARVGIWLSETGAEASVLQSVNKGWKNLAEVEVESTAPLADATAADLNALFAALWGKLPRVARRADTPVFLALPDTHVIEDAIDFEAFPPTPGEADPLVLHRCARDLGREPDLLAVTYEVVARDEDQVTCRVRVMDRPLRDRIETAARRAGFRFSRMDGWQGYASADPQIAQADFAVWTGAQDWSLICASPEFPQGFSDAGSLADGDAALDLITRIVRSYAHRHDMDQATLLADTDAKRLAHLEQALAPAGIRCARLTLPDAARSRAGRIAAWA